MAASVYYAILNQVAVVINSLGLSFTPAGGSPITPQIVVLKEPTVQEFLQTLGEPGQSGSAELPCIVVSPQAESQPVEPACHELFVFVTYPVDITISAGGNRDFASNLDVWLNWRQQVRAQFCGTILPGVPEVYETEPDPEQAIDRATLQDNLDQGTLTIRFMTIESRVQLTTTTSTTTTAGPTTTTTTTTSTTT